MNLHIHGNVNALREILTLVALLLGVVTLAAPAAAWGMHDVAHLGAPVAGGDHHHHGDDGTVDAHGDHEAVPQSDDSPAGKIGHSHMVGSAIDIAAQPDSPERPLAVASGTVLLAADTPALGTLGWSPQIRPPRTA